MILSCIMLINACTTFDHCFKYLNISVLDSIMNTSLSDLFSCKCQHQTQMVSYSLSWWCIKRAWIPDLYKSWMWSLSCCHASTCAVVTSTQMPSDPANTLRYKETLYRIRFCKYSGIEEPRAIGIAPLKRILLAKF